MVGGAWFHTTRGSAGAVTEEDLLARATKAVRDHLNVSAAPVWSHVEIQKVRGNRVAVRRCYACFLVCVVIAAVVTVLWFSQDCIPQYYEGHFQRLGE